MSKHPYESQPDRAFWKRAVASRHYEDMSELWSPPELSGTERFATAGSCFAQHIGRYVSKRGDQNYLDFEPAPVGLPESELGRFGFGIYSCRYGNVYTTRQLLQIAQEAFGKRSQSKHVWERDGRYYDAIRPSVDPVGLESRDQVIELRRLHLQKVKSMFEKLDVFIFTLGLTEAWIDPKDGTAFPSAPGVIAGSQEVNQADFRNLTASDCISDMHDFWALLKSVNPTARMILTVSPVPLIATASDSHVLVATSYSKSVLRVTAQEMAEAYPDVDYFPSYEIVNSAQGRGYYFDPDLRSVNDRGVRYVMSHFFTGALGRAFPEPQLELEAEDVVCDEEAIQEKVESEQ